MKSVIRRIYRSITRRFAPARLRFGWRLAVALVVGTFVIDGANSYAPGPPLNSTIRPLNRMRLGGPFDWLGASICCADEPPVPGAANSAPKSRTRVRDLIDSEIDSAAGGELAGPASDGEFLRRVYLDLAGRIPSASEAREFLASSAADKRDAVVDRLLASPEYPRRMQEAWTVMLLERHEGKAVADEAWNAYLRDAFAKNRPWNEVVRELLAADGRDEATRPAVRFLAEGGRSEPHQRTQDVARLLLGMNIQCAQCHDHPSIDDYKQAHYFGLHAFLSSSKMVNDKQNRAYFLETPLTGKLEFVSVFKPEEKRATGPRLLEGDEVAPPMLPKGEEFERPPQDGLPGIPKFQPRRLLASQMTAFSANDGGTSSPGSRRFARTAVNRCWLVLMGRGIVHPPDLDHSANPPSHPRLLDLLTDEFIANDCDMKWLISEIARTHAYRRSSVMASGRAPSAATAKNQAAAVDAPAGIRVDVGVRPAADRYRAAIVRPQSAEQLARSLAEATGFRAALDRTAAPEKTVTYKDYSNGRIPPPDNWRDVLVVFAGAFGHPAGQAEVDFRPSVEHALFLSNDRLVRAWVGPSDDGLVDRAVMMSTSDAVDELFLAVLTRKPDETESRTASELLKTSVDADSRRAVLEDLVLALIASNEFRLIH